MKGKPGPTLQFLTFSNRFIIKVIECKKRGEGKPIVRVNERDLQEVRGVLQGKISTQLYEKVCESLVYQQAFMSVFRTVVIGGLVVGRGPTRAKNEVFERVLPPTPIDTIWVAKRLKKLALHNLDLLKQLGGGGVPRKDTGGGSSGGSDDSSGGSEGMDDFGGDPFSNGWF